MEKLVQHLKVLFRIPVFLLRLKQPQMDALAEPGAEASCAIAAPAAPRRWVRPHGQADGRR